jgi:predicted dithiol-disulfide oxidoreductase (DUF899 family)
MAHVDDRIEELREQIWTKKQELRALYREREPELVEDYRLETELGEALRLSELFGDSDDLLLVHNMGRTCSYCTMWADGLVGLQRHIRRRAAFVLSSPDEPATLRATKTERGWDFPVVSTARSTLTADLGFMDDRGPLPGVSALHRNADGSIVRTNRDWFGPYDEYNAAWHLFSLLDGGAGDWQPLPADSG